MPYKFYIVKTSEGFCQIVEVKEGEPEPILQKWGPLASYEEAVAKRVGLIRAGQCQPL